MSANSIGLDLGLPFNEPNFPSVMPTQGGGSPWQGPPVPSTRLGPPAPGGPRYADVWGMQNDPKPGSSTLDRRSAPGGAMEAESANSGAGAAMAVAGGLVATVGSYYAAQAQRNELSSQALVLDQRARTSILNARQAQAHADAMIQSGRRQFGALSMRSSGQKARVAATVGARGGVAGVGSAAEVGATMDYQAKLELYSLSADTVRRVEAQRMAVVNLRNDAMIANVSLDNVLRTRRSIQPWLSATTTALNSAAGMIGAGTFVGL